MSGVLPAAAWREEAGLRRITAALSADGGAVRFVGGAVRDTLLCLPVTDIDLATPLRPVEVVRRLESAGIKAVPTGIAHGTITAVAGGKPYEVTTLRRDVETDGRRATVAFADDWQEDAGTARFYHQRALCRPGERRDFRLVWWLDDLAARSVRFIGRRGAAD